MDSWTPRPNPLLDAAAHDDGCDALRSPNYLSLAITMLIVIGMLISYLPQHHRIISRRTSEGLSPWFVLLGTTSATSTFANILTIEPSRNNMACCSQVETAECLGGLLNIAQFAVQWICFALILVLFLVFFRFETAEVPAEELSGKAPGWHKAVVVALLCLFHGLIVIVLTGIFTTALRSHLNFWANLLGVMAGALAAVQYVPQIWTTYHLKHVGSLSIPMMCMQTPGGFLLAGNQFLALGWAGWSNWGIFLLTATMQGCLLAMAIYYELRASQPDESDEGDAYTPESTRPNPIRTYSEGWQDGLPGPYTAHPELYADTEEELERLQDREERQVLREDRPLLRPGGIGTPRNYHTTD
ncbi:PQ loop repeat protein [Plectosphaerella cucumerina]|uniref:PQ loop repeat protein n=1 Tax=Plectosphaerella cucumerina TaxID=40658 RepID=A0A8K0X818_9PEZI|nr:PQ loop repeat protein [Plectosphaerella cucumerina]